MAFTYLKFIGKGVKEGAAFCSMDEDGRNLEIVKGFVGQVNSKTAERLIKDYPGHFETSDEKTFTKQEEAKPKEKKEKQPEK